MSRIVSQAIGLMAAVLTFQTMEIEAYCARCAKIEGDRAKEQAENPQPIRYYDDQKGVQKGDGSNSPSKVGSAKKEAGELALSDNPLSSGDSNKEFFEEDLKDTSNSENGKKANFQSQQRGKDLQQLSYSTLLTIFKTKDFLETLDGSFTLFLPTNEALQDLPQGTLEELTKPENSGKLAQLISNHVVAKKLLKKDFQTYNNRAIKAISGRNLTLRINNDNLTIDNARILRMEPAGYDGVICVIDRILQ